MIYCVLLFCIGNTVKRIRTRNYYSSHKKELQDLGFVYHLDKKEDSEQSVIKEIV